MVHHHILLREMVYNMNYELRRAANDHNILIYVISFSLVCKYFESTALQVPLKYLKENSCNARKDSEELKRRNQCSVKEP